MLTYREAKYVVQRSKGLSKQQALLTCGFSPALAKNPQFIESPEVLAEIEAYRAELVNHALSVGLIDAGEIHEYLSDALRADMRDIQNDDGSFKPRSEWPEIWGRLQEAGEVEVTTEYERSDDGATKEKRGGWDESGTVTKVKLKFGSKVKLLELAMKHVAVRAMQQDKAPELHVHLHAEVTRRLQAALARHERVIEGEVEK